MNRKTYIPDDYSRIVLIGVGGTGGYLAQGLAKMIAGYKLDIKLTFVDPDFVEERNCARQNFWHYEVGHAKAECLAMRLNQQYGLQIGNAVMTGEDYCNNVEHHIYGALKVTCVDSLQARKYYKGRGDWLDMGNGETTGQAIFGNSSNKEDLKKQKREWIAVPTVDHLPCPFTVAKMGKLKPEKTAVACADHPFAEQGVFANEWAAQAGLTILHQLLIKKQLSISRIYFDTDTGRMTPGFITKEIY